MIVGVGSDLVEIARVRSIHVRFGARFVARLLGPQEQVAFARQSDPAPFLAKRFAAKEAALKALGTGLQAGIRWADVQVVNGDFGQPQLLWQGEAARRLSAFGPAVRALVSISDEREHALAFVVIEADC